MDDSLSSYGLHEIKQLAEFYGTETKITYYNVTFTSPPLVDHDEHISEWNVFRRALCKERDFFVSSTGQSKCPSLKDLIQSLETTGAYKGIFPHTFKLLSIFLALPIGTATVERSFSEMKMIKTRLRNPLSHCRLNNLMKIAVEKPQLEKTSAWGEYPPLVLLIQIKNEVLEQYGYILVSIRQITTLLC